MLARIRKAMEEKDEGFTLIELLVVIIIIGILAAIAIPVYLNQRNKGYDAAAKSDAKSLANLEEAWLTDNSAYADVDASTTAAPTNITDFKPTTGVKTKAKASGSNGFCIVSQSKSGKYFVYDSSAGGLQTAGTASFPASTDFPSGGACAGTNGAPGTF
ncbi:MAG TPA: prepilin-type N-terminal cleavage/methylation domain-containing protein [Mycobacteriales bacterium]|jgi:type IV pilus assembly protein PilA